MVDAVIKETPKLGSTKETLAFIKDVVKESAKFLLNDIKKGMKTRKLTEKLTKQDEGLLCSPYIVYHGEKYWVLRYGPNMLRISPPKNFPTGYTVFTYENKIVQDMDLSPKICRLYRIWEEFYVRPYKVLRSKKLLSWYSSIRESIFEGVSKRRLEGYESLDMGDDEKKVFKELDDEVYDFHKIDVELAQLEEKLFDIRLSIFEFPSEENIKNLIRITQRFYELLPVQSQYLERRISVWTKYRYLLERKYKVKINFDFSATDLGFAAFVDLMKYVLFKHIVPEGVLAEVAWKTTKSIAKAKIAQVSMNLLVHYGGLESLRSQSLSLVSLQKGLENYLNAWNAEIPLKMVRLPIDRSIDRKRC